MDKCEKRLGKAIEKINLEIFDPKKYFNYEPALLVYEKNLYKLSTWKELLKVFYYLCNKGSPKAKDLFVSYRDQFLAESDGGLVPYPYRYNLNVLHVNGKCNFTSSVYRSFEGVKFSKDCYVSCYRTDPSRTLLNSFQSSGADNLYLIGKVIKTLRLKKVEFFLANKDFPSSQIEKEKDAIVKRLTDKSRVERKTEKNTKYFIAHINGEILSKEEKFFKRIDSEFNKKPLIGDIVISEEEEKYLRSYMSECLKEFIKNDLNKKIMTHPKVFAFGLVRYAMKYYGKKTFWPYFETEFGIEIKQSVQGEIHETYRYIMKKYKKIYDDQVTMKIDNISMHCFVTDPCADQLFDYIFDYWRLDLNRNIENIYGEEGKKYFSRLIEEIKANNDTAVNNIMKHTSMALALQEKSGRLRLKRILQLMDSCFWEHAEIPQTGNRFNELLRKWMGKEKGKFLQESKIVLTEHGKRGNTLLSRPQLCVSFQNELFSIKFPREILVHCDETEYPMWEVTIGNQRMMRRVNLLEGRIGLYTQECELAFPAEGLFQKMTLTLLSDRRKYKTYYIPADDIRFFNDKGINFECKSGFLPTGNLIIYSKTENVPQVLYRDPVWPSYKNNMYRCLYDLVDGDILKYECGFALPVGRPVAEGLAGKATKGVFIQDGDGRTEIYTSLPKIIFKARREQVGGTFLKIYGHGESERFLRLTDMSYNEFRLDKTLDDVYAYIVDLNDYIFKNDIYTIEMNVPHSKAAYRFRFAYLQAMQFEFLNAPYVFCGGGEICFAADVPIKTNRDWTITDFAKSLAFSFEKNGEDEIDITDNHLVLQYKMADRLVPLYFKIPAFAWKFEKNDEWNYKRPADFSLKKLPPRLYVCGPFDFENKATKLNVDNRFSCDFDETDIYAEKVAGENFYRFNLESAKSWMDRSTVKRTINITLGGNMHKLFDVLCRSYIGGGNLYADHDTKTLYGKFDIIGDSEYSVKVQRNGETVGEDIPLIDGGFSLKTERIGGEYLVTVYEMIEDESGFDFDTVKLGEYPLILADLESMEGRAIAIRCFRDHERKYLPITLNYNYIVRIGSMKPDLDLSLIVGTWKLDLYDDETYNRCTFYSGSMMHFEDGSYKKDFDVLIIFYSKKEVDKFVLLREYEGEYVELLFDGKTRSLQKDDRGLTREQKIQRIVLLADDKYDCIADVWAEETDTGERKQ